MRTYSHCEIKVDTKIKTRIVDARTGKIVKERPWEKNLVLDQGLNGLARDNSVGVSCTPVAAHLFCQVGSGTNPVKIGSGAVTFTQAANTLTASGGFFTAAMVGGLFKWGTGSAGIENYITAFTDATHVTVQNAATIGTPDVGVVWQVQQTQLQTFINQTSTYQTNAGDCVTNYVGNIVTHQRTFVFPVAGASYNVNEIGYSVNSTSTRCIGRLVLSSTDVVSTSQYYVVVIAISFTYTPSAPSAVGNVGTNINTAGNAMIEWFSIGDVNPATGNQRVNTNNGGLDANTTAKMAFYVATYSQNVAIPSGTVPSLAVTGATVNVTTNATWTKLGGVLGKMRLTCTGNGTTSGQSCFGVGLFSTGSSDGFLNNPFFDIKFTAAQTLPNGAFLPQSTWDFTYTRTLVN